MISDFIWKKKGKQNESLLEELYIMTYMRIEYSDQHVPLSLSDWRSEKAKGLIYLQVGVQTDLRFHGDHISASLTITTL